MYQKRLEIAYLQRLGLHISIFFESNLGMKYRKLLMKFADGMEEGIISAEWKLGTTLEEMDNGVDKGKDG